MSDDRKTLGRVGEDLAASFLQKAGYKILVRNYRQKCGELDIIAEDRDILVFIEVKTRRNLAFGPPVLAVTEKKQRQIGRVAQDYLCRHRLANRSARFDVVSVLLQQGKEPAIEVIQNAFEFI